MNILATPFPFSLPDGIATLFFWALYVLFGPVNVVMQMVGLLGSNSGTKTPREMKSYLKIGLVVTLAPVAFILLGKLLN